MKKITNTIFAFVFIISLAWSTSSVEAQIQSLLQSSGIGLEATTTVYEPMAPIPGLTTDTGVFDVAQGGFADFLNNLFNLFLAVAAIAAVLFIMWGGFKYATEEAIIGKSNAKKTIENAFIGLALALTAVLVLKTINPDLLRLDISKFVIKKGASNAYLKSLKAGLGSNALINMTNQQQWEELEATNKTLGGLTGQKQELQRQLQEANASGDDARIQELTAKIADIQKQETDLQKKSILESSSVITGKSIENKFIANPEIENQKDVLFEKKKNPDGTMSLVVASGNAQDAYTIVSSSIANTTETAVSNKFKQIDALKISDQEKAELKSQVDQNIRGDATVQDTLLSNACVDRYDSVASLDQAYNTRTNYVNDAIEQAKNNNNTALVAKLEAAKKDQDTTFQKRRQTIINEQDVNNQYNGPVY